MKIVLREADISDALSISQIERECIECAWSTEQIQEALNNESYVFFVLEADGKIVAYGGVRIIIDEAEICNIATLKEYRRQGYAKMIIAKIDERCQKSGVKGIFIEVNVNNENAIRLYKKMGYKKLNIRKNYYNGKDALIMTRVLKYNKKHK